MYELTKRKIPQHDLSRFFVPPGIFISTAFIASNRWSVLSGSFLDPAFGGALLRRNRLGRLDWWCTNRPTLSSTSFILRFEFQSAAILKVFFVFFLSVILIVSSPTVRHGRKHYGRDQEEDAGDEDGEGVGTREGRSIREETGRSEGAQWKGIIYNNNKGHQNVAMAHIAFLIFSGSLTGYKILLPPEIVLWLVTTVLFPAEVVLYNQSEYQRIREMISFWWTSLWGRSEG